MSNQALSIEENTIIQRILATKNSLGAAGRKVADFVLDKPEAIIYLSVTEAAAQIGVSEATIIRFCQQLDLKGYQDFKIQLSQAIQTPVKTLNEEIELTDSPTQLLRKVSQVMVATISESLRIANDQSLQHAFETLAHANRIEFIGSGGSGIIAQDAHHKFLKLGIPCGVHRDAHNAAQVCSVLTKGDVVVAISYSGSTKDILRSVSLAKEAGAKVLAISRYGKTPLSKIADITLYTLSPESYYRSEGVCSRVAQLCLIDTLYTGVFISDETRFANALQKSRNALTDIRI